MNIILWSDWYVSSKDLMVVLFFVPEGWSWWSLSFFSSCEFNFYDNNYGATIDRLYFCCNRLLREFYKVRWKNMLTNVPIEHCRNGTVRHPLLGYRKTLAKISCKMLLIFWVTSARRCSVVANDHWSTHLLDKLRSTQWLVLGNGSRKKLLFFWILSKWGGKGPGPDILNVA